MRLKFRYVNWRGDDHEYVIEKPELHPTHKARGDGTYWMISGQVVTRDGADRPEMGDSRRRTFELVKMREIEEVGS